MENAKEMLLTTGRLALKVTPRAAREGLDGMGMDAVGVPYLKVRVRAVPEDGKANAAVIAVIAKAFDIPKSCLSMLRGSASRHKIIAYTR